MIDAQEALRKAFLNVAGMSGLAPLAKPFLGGVGAILMLHSVTAAPPRPSGANQHLTITPRFLDQLLETMKRSGYALVSMDEAIEGLKSPGASGHFAAITLDDGFRDNLTEALPVFEAHAAPFCIYIAPALIDGSVSLWWEVLEEIVASRDLFYLTTPEGRVQIDCSRPAKRAESLKRLQEYLTIDVKETDQQRVLGDIAAQAAFDIKSFGRGRLLGWDEIRFLATHPLATIGAHTVSHANLARLTEDQARREIREAARIIKTEIGFSPTHMAYPYGGAGAVGKREAALAKEAGFASAVTTRHGVLRAGHAEHLTALPRISINGRYQRVNHVMTMLSGITTPLANSGKLTPTL